MCGSQIAIYNGKRDLVAVSLFMLAAILAVWTGLAGPLFADGFWGNLEKWQTIWAALIALAAAYVAVRPVYSQLAEQRRQSAAAAVSMIVKAAVSLEAEREIVRKAIDELHLNHLLWKYDELSWHDIYASWPDQAFEFKESCDVALRSLRLYSERNPTPSVAQSSRVDAIDKLEDLRNGVVDLITIMRQTTSGLDYEYGEQDIPVEDHPQKRSQAEINEKMWLLAANKLDEALSTEIAAIWRRIRELESIAIGRL